MTRRPRKSDPETTEAFLGNEDLDIPTVEHRENPSKVLAGLILEKAMTRATRKRLQNERGHAVLVEPPTAAWVLQVRSALCLAFDWGMTDARDGIGRARRPTDGAAELADVIASGQRVVVVCHAPDAHVPPAFIAAADLRIRPARGRWRSGGRQSRPAWPGGAGLRPRWPARRPRSEAGGSQPVPAQRCSGPDRARHEVLDRLQIVKPTGLTAGGIDMEGTDLIARHDAAARREVADVARAGLACQLLPILAAAPETVARVEERTPSVARYAVGMASPKVRIALRAGDLARWDLDRLCAVSASLGHRVEAILVPQGMKPVITFKLA